ncbi:HutD family protein [Lacrimispora sp.]|uniref:HutD family protein n=1 Tax=Lacrimispora sp. TaxID=2719234 RepID=UPI0039963EAD
MDDNIRLLNKTSYKTTAWAGGDTTQIYIYPETAQYEQQDFLYRVSMASVSAEVSRFTKLENYDRILTVLEGSMELEKEKQMPRIPLRPLEPFKFGGEVPIMSYGQCNDFNLMFQKGMAGQVLMLPMDEEKAELVLEPENHTLLYLIKGSLNIRLCQKERFLCAGEALIFNQMGKPGGRLKITRKEEHTLLALCCIAFNG